MTTQLNLDILRLVTDKLTAARNFTAAMELSLVSQVVYDAVYRPILRANTSVTLEGDVIRLKSEILDFFIKSDNATLVALFLDCAGIDINTPYSGFGSIMCAAVDAGAASVVEFLLQAGADPSGNTTCGDHCHPLSRAIDGGDVHITRLLLEHGALQAYLKIHNRAHDAPNQTENIPVLDIIGRATTVEMVETLLPYCSNLNESNCDGLAYW
ncbi:hypothetical protein F4823DRAFT_606174 [Ustulina deusta]|nr:hypothetical protein F4823DRAFT_606174 [Ustulina deusta]